VFRQPLIDKTLLIMKLAMLVGSGKKIGLFTLPFLIIGIALNVLYPDFFSVNGPPESIIWISLVFLTIGIINWIWSVVLIITKIPRKELITTGPYSLVKHPLYTGAALLIFPWIGLICNTWMGILIGIAMYIGSRIFSPEEEQLLSKIFDKAWDEYCKKVKLPWV
jgi:protein-S-isoprenylcysteine O-methyltransferase Ste14